MYTDPEAEYCRLSNPRIFYAENCDCILNWIAEGSDGHLYVVPAEPGGWLRRDDYRGPPDHLVPLASEKAATIAWYVYGDVGKVIIASGL